MKYRKSVKMKNRFHSASFVNPIFGTCREGWNYDFQPYVWKSLFQPALQLQPIRFSKELLWKIVYITRKQNTAKAIRVIAALVSLGQQTSHSLQSLCFAPCNSPSNRKFVRTLFISENGLRHQKKGWSWSNCVMFWITKYDL